MSLYFGSESTYTNVNCVQGQIVALEKREYGTFAHFLVSVSNTLSDYGDLDGKGSKYGFN